MINEASDLDEDVAVQNHEVLGHLGRNLDLVFLQLCVHAEEDVMRCAVVTWCSKHSNVSARLGSARLPVHADARKMTQACGMF